MNIEGPPYKIKRSNYTFLCMKYRRNIEIICQIVIIVLFIILVPYLATLNDLYIYENNGGGRFSIKLVKSNPRIIGIISIYLIGLLFHYFFEFNGIFFKQLWNFHSRTEFGNLYFSLINNNCLKLNFIDDKEFMFSEINYAECRDISQDFMQELNLVDNKFCIIKASLNAVVNDEGEYQYFQNCYDRVKNINISSKPNPMLDNFKEFLIIGKNDRIYRKFNICCYIFFIIIGYGELYKLIFNCFAINKEYSIDKLIFGLNVKIDSFIRKNHPSFMNSKIMDNNQNPAELQELNLNVRKQNEDDQNDIIDLRHSEMK